VRADDWLLVYHRVAEPVLRLAIPGILSRAQDQEHAEHQGQQHDEQDHPYINQHMIGGREIRVIRQPLREQPSPMALRRAVHDLEGTPIPDCDNRHHNHQRPQAELEAAAGRGGVGHAGILADGRFFADGGIEGRNVRTITTSHVERLNGRQRLFLKRLNRLTLCFSKKLANLEAAFAMFACWYNYVWQTREKGNSGKLRPTAAMMAGLTSHVWSFDELFSEVLK
jgi:hypothetical protein